MARIYCRFTLIIARTVIIISLLSSAKYYTIMNNIWSNYYISLPEKNENLSLCIQDILQRQKMTDNRSAVLYSSSIVLTSGQDYYQPNSNCRLHHYQFKDTVNCIDQLSSQRRRPVHIAFVGDSIIRHQFVSFIRV